MNRFLHRRLLRPLPLLFLIVLAAPPSAAAAEAPAPKIREFTELLKPDRISLTALSPDGRVLAYVVHFDVIDELVLVSTEKPGPGWKRRAPRITALRWATPGTLVYLEGQDLRAVDAPGWKDRKLVGATDLVVLPPDFNGEDLIAAEAEQTEEPAAGPSTAGSSGTAAGTAASTEASTAGDAAPGTASDPTATAADASASATASSIEPAEPAGTATSATLRLLGPLQGAPGFILVEAANWRDAEGYRQDANVFRIDVDTGAREFVTWQYLPGRRLYDQLGRARLAENPPLRRAQGELLPQVQRITFRSPSAGLVRWQDLDRLLAPSPPWTFRHDHQTYFAKQTFPVAMAADPDVVYVASNTATDRYGIYALDLARRQRTDFALEDPVFDLAEQGDGFSDSRLVLGRDGRLAGVRRPGRHAGTVWVDRELRQLEEGIAAKFKGRTVNLLEWSEARDRFLVHVSTAGFAGRYYVHDRATGQFTEFLQDTTAAAAALASRTEPFQFTSPGGTALTGTITRPRNPRLSPPPLVVYCRDLPGTYDRTAFLPDIQALAAMGFAVLQVNYRGSAGFGSSFRDAAKAGFDRIPIEDLRAALSWAAEGRLEFDRRRVALVGEDFGGYVALRAVQLHPDEFRCAVALNAPTDPAAWVNRTGVATRGGQAVRTDIDVLRRRAFFEAGAVPWNSISVLQHADLLKNPVLIVQDRRETQLPQGQGPALRNRLRSVNRDSEYLEVDRALTADATPDQRAVVFLRMQEFFVANLFNFNVEVGPLREVK